MTKKYQFQQIEISDPRWEAWISTRPESILFHHSAWVGMICACYGYHPFVAVIVDEDGQLCAGVPLIETTGFTRKRRWVSLPFTDFCPPLGVDAGALSELQLGILNLVKQNNLVNLELRWEYPSEEFHSSSQFVRTVVDLEKGVAKVSTEIKSNHRRKFRSAVRRGIRVEHGTSLEEMKIFYGLQVETRRRLGVPVQPWKFFELLHEKIIARGLGFVSLAYLDSEVLAGVVYLYWNRHLIYKFAASNEFARKNYASDLLIWDGIEWGCQNGAIDLDLGRSSRENEGLRQYKLRWSGKEMPLVYTRNYQKQPEGLQQRLFPVMTAIIQHTPKWVCRFSGQCLYRYFG